MLIKCRKWNQYEGQSKGDVYVDPKDVLSIDEYRARILFGGSQSVADITLKNGSIITVVNDSLALDDLRTAINAVCESQSPDDGIMLSVKEIGVVKILTEKTGVTEFFNACYRMGMNIEEAHACLDKLRYKKI